LEISPLLFGACVHLAVYAHQFEERALAGEAEDRGERKEKEKKDGIKGKLVDFEMEPERNFCFGMKKKESREVVC
jgi:hypothetical protein